MTMYYSIRLRARLLAVEMTTAADFRDFVRENDLSLHLDSEASDSYGVEPSFGRELRFSGEPFGGISGIQVEDGMLSFGCSSSNLTWEFFDEIDDIRPNAGFTRFEALLRALSKITAGGTGEVQGVAGYDEHDDPCGWPIIRCDDGILRISMTPSSRFSDTTEASTLVPEVLPSHVLRGNPHLPYVVDIDLEKLADALEPIDILPAPRPLDYKVGF